jgi:MOSC domain-containing protein YiiM
MGKLTGNARRDKKRAPMQELEQAEVDAATGVAADFRGRPGKRQVTVLSARAWRDVCSELDTELPWTIRRANVLVDDIDLRTEQGGIVQIGEVQLRVNAETDPCFRMDEQCAGLTRILQTNWRGGVSCNVLKGGAVSLGDAVTYRPAD